MNEANIGYWHGHFGSSERNGRLDLGRKNISVKGLQGYVTEDVGLSVVFANRAQYQIASETPRIVHTCLPFLANDQCLIRFASENSRVLITDFNSDYASNNFLKFFPEKDPISVTGNGATRMQAVIFRLFNFPDLTMPFDHFMSENAVRPRLLIQNDDWAVYLFRAEQSPGAAKELHSEGGYLQTHWGYFCSAISEDFDGDSARSVIGILNYFFSFLQGSWCHPVCPFGINQRNEIVWEQLNLPREAWSLRESWFDRAKSDELSDLFRGFARAMSNESWGFAIKDALYWYIRANNSTSGIDGNIVLAQTAFERLAYQHDLNAKNSNPGQKPKDTRASSRIRALCSTLQIPVQIPLHLKHLDANTEGKKIVEDLPHLITKVRNSIVHPDKGKHGAYARYYAEVWRLALWSLELVILRLCEFKGHYLNRTRSSLAYESEAIPS